MAKSKKKRRVPSLRLIASRLRAQASNIDVHDKRFKDYELSNLASWVRDIARQVAERQRELK